MFDKILQIFDGQNEEFSIYGLLRLIRFDTDYQETVKAFQKYIAASYNVEDAKGNPGAIGHFYLTNLRVIWQMKADPSINLSFGLDGITSTDIKTVPVQFGNGLKYILTIKVQNPSQTKYQFKFSGIHPDDLRVFQKVSYLHKKVLGSKLFRHQNIALKCQQNFKSLQGQEIRAEYNNMTFIEDQHRCSCKLITTNARIVIVKDYQKKINWSLPWIMIRSVQFSAQNDIFRGVRLFCRGILGQKVIFLYCINQADTKKLQYQLRSFCQVYNKTPCLGYSYQQQKNIQETKTEVKEQIQQLETTKVNIGRRKNVYTSTGLGNIKQTEFNNQLGLMMEKLPEGVKRADLWQIIK